MLQTTVPVVLLGRYSTFAGTGTFTGLPVDVTEFDSIELNVWRGALPAGVSFAFKLEASLDGDNWSNLIQGDPGTNTEVLYDQSLKAFPWIRTVVTLSTTGTHPVASCYAVGLLIKRR